MDYVFPESSRKGKKKNARAEKDNEIMKKEAKMGAKNKGKEKLKKKPKKDKKKGDKVQQSVPKTGG